MCTVMGVAVCGTHIGNDEISVSGENEMAFPS